MKTTLFTLAVLTGLFTAVPLTAASLVVASSAAQAGSLYNYSYTFSIAGSGLALDNLFLGSDDLSPLNVTLTFDGSPAVNWSWLGNDTPQNYLDFFDTANGTLGSGDTLNVTFTSAFAPAATHFAEGLNSVTSATSNLITGVTAPTAAPEPASAFTVLLGLGSIGFIASRVRR